MLDKLIELSTFIIREAKAQFKKPMVLWSTGKDSTTLLYLIRSTFRGEIPFPVVHMDTGRKFPEMYEFRDKLVKAWNLDLKVVCNEEWMNKVNPNNDRLDCCRKLKIDSLKSIMKQEQYDAVFVSIRRDEHGIRMKDRYFSPRDRNFRWNVSRKSESGDSGLEALQPIELSGWGLFFSDFGKDCNHVRIHPLLHWTELDVWKYIERENIPVNTLYFSNDGKRYRSLGCVPCTFPIESTADSVGCIIKELETTTISERSGRAQDKEAQYAMEYLRMLGYM